VLLQGLYSHGSDVWAAGVTMLYVSTGDYLFKRPDAPDDRAYLATYHLNLADMAREAAAAFVADRELFGNMPESLDWETVVASMLTAHFSSRPTVTECLSLLASTEVAWANEDLKCVDVLGKICPNNSMTTQNICSRFYGRGGCEEC